MLPDLIHAWRSLRRSKGYTAVALLTLALGLGANAAIFSAVLGVVLRPLPVRAPDRLVWVGHAHRENGVVAAFSPQDFDDLARATTGGAFSVMADYSYLRGLSGMNLTGAGEPLRVPVAGVSGAYFQTLGAAAALGRPLLPADDQPGANHVVVLSNRLWRSRFGHDPAVVGRKVMLDGAPFTVAGVMPVRFELPDREVGIWAPLSLTGEDQVPHRRGIRWLSVVGRLAPGVTQRAATAQVATVLARLERQFPESNKGWGRAAVRPLQEVVVGDVRALFAMLFAAVGLVLLIVCVNLANLTVARATGRRRELAIRAAIGATQGRLARQLLVESLVLAVAGGALGLLFARWGVAALAVMGADYLPRAGEMRLDGVVVVFTLALAVAAGLGFGLLPALSAAGGGLRESMQPGGGGAGWRRGSGHRGAGGLVVLETALATVLLLAAGLLLRSFWQLLHVDPGFRPDSVLMMSITMPDAKTLGPDAGSLYSGAILQRLRSLPGVAAAGTSHTAPLAGGGEPYSFVPEGAPAPKGMTPEEMIPASGAFFVSSGYFRALGIPLVAGRDFDRRDDEGKAPPAVIVNQALARQLWPGQDPLGKRLRSGRLELAVVGVAADVRNDGLAAPPRPAVYGSPFIFARSTLKLFLRTTAPPFAVLAAARRAIWEVNPEQPISEVATLDQVVAAHVARPRLLSWLVGGFGVLAALLAAFGTYGVIAYGVRRRTREIGVRMALGANRSRVVGLVVRQGLAFALSGLACGLVAGLACAPLLGGLLFGVGPADPLTFAAVALLIASAALAASYLPAREAAGVDPLVAIRAE
jgi:putative ABC transport system permease protein